MTVSDDNGDELLTTSEVAELCKVSPGTVRRWRYDGELRFVQFGYRTIRHTRADVEGLIVTRTRGWR